MQDQLQYLQLQDDTLEIGFSKRTLQRDIREMRNIFGIEIEYSKKENGYFIRETENNNENFQRMLEAFELFNSVNASQNAKPYIHFEKRRPQGTEHLFGLLHAVENRRKISFNYCKYWEDNISYRTVEPYALKEFRNRWYIMANDEKDRKIKSFALDRITNLQIQAEVFKLPPHYSPEQSYCYCFGIVGPNGHEPEEIVLAFTASQGKYIKSLPLHGTQQIVVDNKDELQIKLKLFITHDFVMELLSFGPELKVISPISLKEELLKSYTQAIENYSDDLIIK
ncbi:YafY family protein [Rufibacter sp. LB8]|uniref:helix-turn-helix transcriptional regulator n=1 Tax=Rufibacter sp. LB8 TaxID=2777781 RepID=UPI001CEF83CC|nr:WYL domain-containing protein [Rufibacter sp. LB8]